MYPFRKSVVMLLLLAHVIICADTFCSAAPVITYAAPPCKGKDLTLTAPVTDSLGTYSWQTMPSGTSGFIGPTTDQTAVVYASGTYQVTVTSSTGISYTIDTAIFFFSPTSVIASSTNASCIPGSDGSITATPSGGTTPYTYSWYPLPGSGQGTASISNLGAGNYTLLLTTADGCTASCSSTITNPGGLSTSTTQINETCHNGITASATVITTGGTPPYSYSWSPSGGTGVSAVGLTAGTYTVTVLCGTSCRTSSVVTITQPTPLKDTLTYQTASCGTCADGSASVMVTGGTGGSYTYSWSPAGGVLASASGLLPGTYNCCVTDANNCTHLCTSFSIGFITGILSQQQKPSFIVSPNPFGNSFRVESALSDKEATLILYNAVGKLMLTQKISSGVTLLGTSDLSEGIYFLRIVDGGMVVNFKIIKE
jgi:hypothetical protein